MDHSIWFTLMLGLFLGFTHALEPDHMVAVSSIASETKKLKKSALSGVFWGIGHTTTLFIVGMTVILLKTAIPSFLATSFEFFVGVMIVFLGFNSMRNHMHHEKKVNSASKVYKKAMFIGVIHGLAGSAAMVLTTLSTVDTPSQAAFYLLIFGFGTVLGMQLFSTAFASIFIFGQAFNKLHHYGIRFVSIFSICYGCYYMLHTLSLL